MGSTLIRIMYELMCSQMLQTNFGADPSQHGSEQKRASDLAKLEKDQLVKVLQSEF